jgi:hypothetical protein
MYLMNVLCDTRTFRNEHPPKNRENVFMLRYEEWTVI